MKFKSLNSLKIIFACFIFIAPSEIYSQVGVGVFNINKTKVDIIDSISSITQLNTRVSFEENYKWERYNKDVKSTRGIIELRKDTNNYGNSDKRTFTDSNIKVFYINYFLIGQMPVFNIYLTFYQNLLIHFECAHSPEFIDAFKHKFGDGETRSDSKEITCQNGFGAITTNYDIRIYYNWLHLDKTISANALSAAIHNDKCEPFIFNSFSLQDDTKVKIVDAIEKKYKDAYEQKLKQEKEKKYDGF